MFELVGAWSELKDKDPIPKEFANRKLSIIWSWKIPKKIKV